MDASTHFIGFVSTSFSKESDRCRSFITTTEIVISKVCKTKARNTMVIKHGFVFGSILSGEWSEMSVI